VRWPDNEGVVVSRNVLQRTLLVRTREQGLVRVAADDVTMMPQADSPVTTKEEKHEDPNREWTEPGAPREA